MSTNILLIIIIVLLVLGLAIQLFQLFAILTIPDQFFDPLLNRFENDDGDDYDDDIDYGEPVIERSTKGFVKTRKSKKAKWTVPDKTSSKKAKDKRKTKESAKETATEVEVEVVNGAGENFRAK